MKKRLQTFIIPILLILMLIQVPVFAETTENDTETTKIESTTKKNELTTNNFLRDDYTANVTLDEVTNKLERKGYQVVESMQTVVAPILVILLIVSFLVSSIGFVSKAKNMVGYGIAAMLLIGFAYVGIMYAPEILDFFKNFMME